MSNDYVFCVSLDTIAWDLQSKIPKRRDFEKTRAEIQEFMNSQQNWVIEGCYADLLLVAICRTHAIFTPAVLKTHLNRMTI